MSQKSCILQPPFWEFQRLQRQKSQKQYVVPKSFKKRRIIDRMLFFLDSIIVQLKEVYVKCIHHVTTRIANCLQENIMSLDILLLFTKALCWRLSMEHVKCINFSQYAVSSKIQNKCIILRGRGTNFFQVKQALSYPLYLQNH